MKNLIADFLVYFWALFFVIDAIGVVPMFLCLTSGKGDEFRRAMADKASVIAFFILSFFALAGSFILQSFGISLPAFKIGGGILLLLLSIEMVFSKPHSHDKGAQADEDCDDVSVFPLSVPLLSGPGAITLLIIYMRAAGHDFAKQGIVLFALLINIIIVWILLRFSTKISKYLGKTGINVITKIFGILLTAMACQLFIDGILDAFLRNKVL